jgi:glycosyltransferase involved in cell wall biosynthesis
MTRSTSSPTAWTSGSSIRPAGLHGLDFLLESLSALSGAARRHLRFAIMGRGPLEPMVANAASAAPELLDYVGVVPPDEMPGYYAACDVFVIPRPSTLPAETVLPMKLLEALAMEKPALVSDVAAMTEVVRDGQNGLTFRKGDRGAFVRQLEGLRERAAALMQLGAQAREDMARQYTWATSRDKLQAIYAALAPAGVRRRECGAA